MDPNATNNVLAALLASARQPGPFNTFLQGLGKSISSFFQKIKIYFY